MANFTMLEQGGHEPKPDIIVGFNERFKLPPEFKLPEGGVEYNGSDGAYSVRAFSVAIEHERGTLTGQITVGVDFSPIMNLRDYRGISAGGGSKWTSYGGERPIYTPFGSVNVLYPITEKGFENSKRQPFEGMRFFPPVILSTIINGFRVNTMTKAFNNAQGVVVSANGRVFGGSEGGLDAMNVISPYNTWREFITSSEHELTDEGFLYLPYSNQPLQDLEFVVGELNFIKQQLFARDK